MDLQTALNLPYLQTPPNTANYPEIVRVVELEATRAGGFEALKNFPTQTAELCCGTHVLNSGDIKAITVTGFSGISQGKKRITVLCGKEAENALNLGEVLRRECLQLRQKVRQAWGSANWMSRLKANNKEITHNVIPRSYRDRLMVDSSQLRFVMTLKMDEIRIFPILGKYVEVIDSFEQIPDLPVLVKTDFGSFKDVQASFRRTELLGLSLFVNPDNLVVLGCPHADYELLEKVGSEMFSGVKVGKCRGELNLFWYGWMTQTCVDGLRDICRKVLEDGDKFIE